MKKVLNKWQFCLRWGNYYYNANSRQFVFGIFKLKSFPEEGCAVIKENYKGFLIQKDWKTKPNIEISF